MKHALVILALAVAASPAAAQPERYELGRRLKAFEVAWEAVPDPAARKRALKDLPQVTTQFFSFRFGDAGRTLDLAAHALRGDAPPAADARLAQSFFPNPESRFLDDDATELSVVVKPFYPVDGAAKSVTVKLQLADGKPVTATADTFPITVKVPLPPPKKPGSDSELSLVTTVGKEEHRVAVVVSRAERRDQRIGAVRLASDRLLTFTTIEEATARDRYRLLTDLRDGNTVETDSPAARLLAEAEAMRDGKPFFTPSKPGQFWLSVPLGEKKTAPLRVFVPKGLDASMPVPVVFALHGAGGSENLFFEGYGAGQIVKECEKRGWFLVATRSGLGFANAPPVAEVLEQLAKRYPLDAKRVVRGRALDGRGADHFSRAEAPEAVRRGRGARRRRGCAGRGRVRRAATTTGMSTGTPMSPAMRRAPGRSGLRRS